METNNLPAVSGQTEPRRIRFDQIDAVGELLARSGMFGCATVEQGKIVALTCHLEGITPLQFKRTYHIIDGNVSMRADAMQAEFQRRGGRVRYLESTREVCRAEFTHPLHPDPIIFEQTLAEHVASGMALGRDGKLKKNYRESPRQMLRARLISEAVRAIDPAVVSGCYTPEEVADLEQPEQEVRHDAPAAPLFSPPPHEPELLPAPLTSDQNEQAQLCSVIEDELRELNLLDEAIAFLREMKWIGPEDGLGALNIGHLRSIGSGMGRFVSKLNARVVAEDAAMSGVNDNA